MMIRFLVLLALLLPLVDVSGQQTQSAPDSSESQNDQDYLAEVKKIIEGKEGEPAEKVFHNISILKGKRAERLPGMMSALTELLGVNCSYCHTPVHWDDEGKPAKKIARQHFEMQAELNNRYFNGKNAITCWTCHKGQPKPESL
jgi:hypothetical protein